MTHRLQWPVQEAIILPAPQASGPFGAVRDISITCLRVDAGAANKCFTVVR
jgi:hypothetical protein